MRKIILKRSFLFGFAVGMITSALLNISSAMPDDFFSNNRGICFDCYETYGFPFTMHEYGTILHLDHFIWSGVVANLTVALVGSFLLGIVFNFLGQFFASKRNNLP
jgi:hypothetical protein